MTLPSYWLIRSVLLLSLLFLGFVLLRPVKSETHQALRRLGILALTLGAAVTVLFPGLLNRVAVFMGVEKGINLLVYALVLALFVHLATAWRREAQAERRITQLARAMALSNVRDPQTVPRPQGDIRNGPATPG